MLKPSDSIEVLKAKIYYCHGTPMSQQRLIFNGQELKDGKTVCDYGITDEDSIIMG